MSALYEVKYFTDEFDRLADEADPDLWAYRRERHLAAVLHIQVQQFFMSLEAALAPRITDPLSGGRLLQLGLSVAEELKLEPDEGDPDLLDQFAYMHALADAIPFDATYDVGFAPDGTISILAVSPVAFKIEWQVHVGNEVVFQLPWAVMGNEADSSVPGHPCCESLLS